MRCLAERVADLLGCVANDHHLPVRPQTALDCLDHAADTRPAADVREQFHAAFKARASARRRDDDQCPFRFFRVNFHFEQAISAMETRSLLAGLLEKTSRKHERHGLPIEAVWRKEAGPGDFVSHFGVVDGILQP